MAASGGMPGGMPPGMGSPDQAAMAQQMMANMSPDQMNDMMKMAGPMMESMSKNGMGAPGAGGMPDQAAMASGSGLPARERRLFASATARARVCMLESGRGVTPCRAQLNSSARGRARHYALYRP